MDKSFSRGNVQSQVPDVTTGLGKYLMRAPSEEIVDFAEAILTTTLPKPVVVESSTGDRLDETSEDPGRQVDQKVKKPRPIGLPSPRPRLAK